MPDRALIYGINEYESISDLRGCVNDVHNVSELLQQEFDFSVRNIRTRTDEDVVLRRMKQDWKWLVEGARPGDRLVFHFSGHGSHVLDIDGDEDDGADEILCLYDMDFENPSSYLKDDQIHKWTRKLPEGVRLTFILDCCHSGTATRALGTTRSAGTGTDTPLEIVEVSSARKNLSDVRSASRRRQSRSARGGDNDPLSPAIALARYVVPPENVRRVLLNRGTRSTLKAESDATNHVRFSGCKDDQTSADAYIEDEFQGAFSHYFCRTIRDAEGKVPHHTLIEDVRDALGNSSFTQTPQLHPKGLTTHVFDGLQTTAMDDEVENVVDEELATPAIRLLQQLNAKLDKVLSVIGEQPTRQSAKPAADQAKRSLVYVHGICFHEDGYSDDWFEAMRRHLSTKLSDQLAQNRHEVLWSEHVTSRERALESQRSDEERELAEAIEDLLRDRAEQTAALQSGQRSASSQEAFGSRDLQRALLGVPGLDCIDDFMKYLLRSKTRRKVMHEFEKVVLPLLKAGHEVHVIAHSWGTVVALETLHDLDADYPGTIKNFFTVGSALSIRPVQRRLRFGARGGKKPSLVENWVNLDARGDIVGGTLRGFSKEVDAEFLNLEPTGCATDGWFISASCAHSSYFDKQNSRVNRDIFAQEISDASRS